MFEVNPTNAAVTMHCGDTGSYRVAASRSSGEPFDAVDRALYTVQDSAGKNVIEREYALDDETLGNGVIRIEFHNSDTDTLPPGQYNTEIRYFIGPYRVDGEIKDGNVVRTPIVLKSTLTLLSVLREV